MLSSAFETLISAFSQSSIVHSHLGIGFLIFSEPWIFCLMTLFIRFLFGVLVAFFQHVCVCTYSPQGGIGTQLLQ